MFIPVPPAEAAHVSLPKGPGLNVPSVLFRALVLDSHLDAGDDVTPDELERNAENLDAAAGYVDALITLAANGTRDQMLRHLIWFRDRLNAESHNRRTERRQQLARTA
jgi:hypothetical protein